MKIEVINNSSYKQIRLQCEGKSYNLLDNCVFQIEPLVKESLRISIDICEKNNVYPNFIDLFFGVVNPENSICRLKCSYVCDIIPKSDNFSIIINDLISSHKENVIYESVFIDSENAIIQTIDYKLSNVESTKKRHAFLQIFIMSSLPLTLFLVVLCIINFSWGLLAIIILDVLWLVIPGIRKIKYFDKLCTNENARDVLLDIEFKQRNGMLYLLENETKTDKILFKIFDKIFKE